MGLYSKKWVIISKKIYGNGSQLLSHLFYESTKRPPPHLTTTKDLVSHVIFGIVKHILTRTINKRSTLLSFGLRITEPVILLNSRLLCSYRHLSKSRVLKLLSRNSFRRETRRSESKNRVRGTSVLVTRPSCKSVCL